MEWNKRVVGYGMAFVARDLPDLSRSQTFVAAPRMVEKTATFLLSAFVAVALQTHTYITSDTPTILQCMVPVPPSIVVGKSKPLMSRLSLTHFHSTHYL